MSQQLEIEATDVIKIMLQFCKEHSMNRAFEAIQEDCQVSLNAVDDVEAFVGDISAGRWDAVLPQVSHLRLPTAKLINLYEQVVFELIELREIETARAVLRTLAVFRRLQRDDPERFMRLERLCNPMFADVRELYGEEGKAKRRAVLAHSLAQEVTSVPPGRLMNIIGDALCWRRHLGTLPQATGFDLLHGTAHKRRDEVEAYPSRMLASVAFGARSHAESAAFTPAGDALVTGSVDGFIEVWDAETAKLKRDLVYQDKEEFMMHEKPVLCLALSRDGAAVVSGDQAGMIKVWKLASGRCIQRFERAHAAGVTAVAFSRDAAQVLSGSFDGAVRVHGLRSGKLMKEFRGHRSYVNCALFSLDGAHVYSGSSDGLVMVWDAKTCECLQRINPEPQASTEIAISAILLNPVAADELLVCMRSNAVHSISISSGKKEKTWSSGQTDASAAFVAAATSARGTYLYALGGDGNLYCFSTETGHLEHLLQCHKPGSAIGLAVHPLRNIVATFADEPELKCWIAG